MRLDLDRPPHSFFFLRDAHRFVSIRTASCVMGSADRRRQRAPKRSKRREMQENVNESSFDTYETSQYGAEQHEDDPAWVTTQDVNTPFGFVPAQMQAYFKEMNGQLTEKMQSEDPEDAQMLLQAALSEMDGYELALATDPSCSLVLENMASMLQEKPLRVLLDRMTGNFTTLARHRYGSHVLQALFTAVQRIVHTGCESLSVRTDQGVLRTLAEIVHDMYEEIDPCLGAMISEPFASHTLRSIVALLAGVPMTQLTDLRSKRSAKYRSKEHRKTAMVEYDNNVLSLSTATNEPLHVDPMFHSLLRRLYDSLHSALTTERLHALVPEPTAAPTLSMLLQLESSLPDGDAYMSWRHDSLTSRVLGPLPEHGGYRTDMMEAALRDAVATHVLQSALQGASPTSLIQFWRIYLEGRIVKLGAHPCANFVVATVLRLLHIDADVDADPDAAKSTPFALSLQELALDGEQLVKKQVCGVLQTIVERSIETEAYEAQVMRVIKSAFRFGNDTSSSSAPSADVVAKFVPVVLSLHTLRAYTHLMQDQDAPTSSASTKPSAPAKRKRGDIGFNPYTTQGSVLLQRIAQLREPNQTWLYESLCTEPLGTWCRSSTAVHVVLAALTSRTASFAQRRMLVRALLPKLLDLCDDAWGSRVADALWLSADGFTKEKIAQSVVQHEKRLLASAYGRFFVRRLRLGLYRKDVDEWKAWAVHDQTLRNSDLNSKDSDTLEWSDKSTRSSIQNPFVFLRHSMRAQQQTSNVSHTHRRAEAELNRIFSQVEDAT